MPFDYYEHDNLDKFTKWTSVIERTHEQPEPIIPITVKHTPAAINEYVNTHVKYKRDKKDEWQTAYETLSLGTGDCEDYAIAKYQLLRNFGYSARRLKLVVSYSIEDKEVHTFLLVDDEQLLDINNRPPSNYQVYFAINEDHWWSNIKDDKR